MLNKTTFNLGQVTNTVQLNAPCSGIMQRSNPSSKFIRFHKNSEVARWVFSGYPRLVEFRSDPNYKPIIVLQIMVFGDNEMLVEYVYKEDMEKVISDGKD